MISAVIEGVWRGCGLVGVGTHDPAKRRAPIRKAVRGIDEALALCCLRGRTFFEWEPKYPSAREAPLPRTYYNFEERHLRDLEAIAGLLGALSENDRVAIYRSI